ncbi:hypothetical protein [uncultured Acinetobacter sp.]|uniref:hypothetical protein n=1 Tax=uncultured Acinetobacter sp. TaxID=165433 RepID=UPI003749A380
MNIKEDMKWIEQSIEFDEIDKIIKRLENNETVSPAEIKEFIINLERNFHLSVEYYSIEFLDALENLKKYSNSK